MRVGHRLVANLCSAYKSDFEVNRLRMPITGARRRAKVPWRIISVWDWKRPREVVARLDLSFGSLNAFLLRLDVKRDALGDRAAIVASESIMAAVINLPS